MLEHVVARLSETVSPIVVVIAEDQPLPPLPADVMIATDEIPDAGPLAGILAGLDALAGKTTAAFVTSCDAPLLQTNFVQAMIQALDSHLLAIPREEDFLHPLAAVYRTELTTTIRTLLEAGQRRPASLVEQVSAIEVDVSQLKQHDPELDSLRNINTPAAYQALLDECGHVQQPQ